LSFSDAVVPDYADVSEFGSQLDSSSSEVLAMQQSMLSFFTPDMPDLQEEDEREGRQHLHARTEEENLAEEMLSMRLQTERVPHAQPHAQQSVNREHMSGSGGEGGGSGNINGDNDGSIDGMRLDADRKEQLAQAIARQKAEYEHSLQQYMAYQSKEEKLYAELQAQQAAEEQGAEHQQHHQSQGSASGGAQAQSHQGYHVGQGRHELSNQGPGLGITSAMAMPGVRKEQQLLQQMQMQAQQQQVPTQQAPTQQQAQAQQQVQAQRQQLQYMRQMAQMRAALANQLQQSEVGGEEGLLEDYSREPPVPPQQPQQAQPQQAQQYQAQQAHQLQQLQEQQDSTGLRSPAVDSMRQSAATWYEPKQQQSAQQPQQHAYQYGAATGSMGTTHDGRLLAQQQNDIRTAAEKQWWLEADQPQSGRRAPRTTDGHLRQLQQRREQLLRQYLSPTSRAAATPTGNSNGSPADRGFHTAPR
jgi:hypothetical protein